MILANAGSTMTLTSLMVALIGAYVGLGVAERARGRRGGQFYSLLAIAAASLGLGMSFMLLFCKGHRMTMTGAGLTIIGFSIGIAIIALFCTLVLMCRSDATQRSLMPAGILSGISLAVIQYGDVAAIDQRVDVQYSPGVVVWTVLFAIFMLGVALWLWRVSWNRDGLSEHVWNSSGKMLIGLTTCGTYYISRLGIHIDWNGPRHGTPAFVQNAAMVYILGASMVVLFGLIHFSTYMDRRDSTAKLFESEQRYKSLFEHNSDAVYTLDLEGKFSSVNAAVERISGYRSEELINRPFVDFLFEEDVSISRFRFKDSLKGNVSPVQLDFRHKEGHRVTIQIQKVVMMVGGKVVGLYGIARDITEQKRTEDLLRNSERLSVVGKLAAGLAHEIRNPLTGLKGFTQLLRSRAEGYTEYCDIMLSELDRIETIVSELLLLAKPQASQYQRCDLQAILNRCIALMESQALLNNVTVRTTIDGQLAPIWCEENQLKQVFINVLKNAMEAMPSGGTIHVCATNRDGHALIEMADEGCGIPPDQIDKLGEPFYTTKEKGTGLGLMVCTRIIRNHHGTLNIRSQVGEGTTIEIRLPLSLPEHEGTAS